MEAIDVHALAQACGLRPSRVLTGGVYLMDENALRAFARSVISSSSVAVAEPAVQDTEEEAASRVYPLRQQMSQAA
jgi:hypothetical protein